MSTDWQDLTRITRGAPIVVERVRLVDTDIALEGRFELPPLARLSAEDQYFVIAFVRSHGSIKEMERVFGVSYPTVKNRLNRLSEQLELVQTYLESPHDEVLGQLERGEIEADEAIRRLS